MVGLLSKSDNGAGSRVWKRFDDGERDRGLLDCSPFEEGGCRTSGGNEESEEADACIVDDEDALNAGECVESQIGGSVGYAGRAAKTGAEDVSVCSCLGYGAGCWWC